MNENIKAGGDIHAGDGGYSIGTKEKYDEFVKNRNRMNERIKELAEQATSIVEMVSSYGYMSSYANFDREKFAELIVKECCRVMESLPPSTYHVGRTRMSEEIKQHFGVEE